MSLSREDILGADDLKRAPVEVPEWGGTVYVRELTGAEAIVYDAWLVENREDKIALAGGFSAMIVMLSACDEQGRRLFGNEDLEAIKAKASAPVMRIAEAAQHLNKMGADDFEDEVKNSDSGQIVASISG